MNATGGPAPQRSSTPWSTAGMTGAKAAKRSRVAGLHAAMTVMAPPLDSPVSRMRVGSTHAVATRWSTTDARKEASSTPAVEKRPVPVFHPNPPAPTAVPSG